MQKQYINNNNKKKIRHISNNEPNKLVQSLILMYHFVLKLCWDMVSLFQFFLSILIIFVLLLLHIATAFAD